MPSAKQMKIPTERTTMAGKAHRIDVHHHFAPPAWITAVKGRELLHKANTEWTPDRSIEDMDEAGVATAVVSITNPGLWFGDQRATRKLARACNEYGAGLVQERPDRFGLFAVLPMPDVDAALAEIAHAYDTLEADGMHLFTSYGDVWLGNQAFEPVMAELNRRGAVVHVHPTAANCCKNLIPDVKASVLEYGTDTSRAMLGVLSSGQAARYPDIQFIWSHAGGTLPFLAGRVESMLVGLKEHEVRLPNGVVPEMQRFNYDLAGAANKYAMSSLMQLVDAQKVLFGTDFPPAGPSIATVRELSERGFADADLRSIERDNAVRLMPRLATGRWPA
jgi:predicted TIM-barrel fold metal-dependent hydrolase